MYLTFFLDLDDPVFYTACITYLFTALVEAVKNRCNKKGGLSKPLKIRDSGGWTNANEIPCHS